MNGLEKEIRKKGVDFGLMSLAAIGEYCGFRGKTFASKVRRNYFTVMELQAIFKRLAFSTEEVGRAMK